MKASTQLVKCQHSIAVGRRKKCNSADSDRSAPSPICNWFGGSNPQRIWLAVFILGVGVSLGMGGGMDVGELRRATLTFYGKGELEPEAIIRIGSAQKTHQRRGYYRIGLLPGLLLKDVTVEILKPESVQDSLANTDGHLRALGNGTRVELYHLRVVVVGKPVAEIKADRLVMDSDGVWKLKGNITLSLNQQLIVLKSAQLTVAGDQAGRLAFESINGHQVINLLSIDQANVASPIH